MEQLTQKQITARAYHARNKDVINARKKAQYHQSATKSTKPRVVKPKAVATCWARTTMKTKPTEREVFVESVSVSSAAAARREARRKIEDRQLAKELGLDY